MTVPVWRIAVEAPTYSADDMAGVGAKRSGGRWNSRGTAMVYCAKNIALAALESLSQFRAGSLPFNRFLVRIDVPDQIWSARRRSALLLVPSVIVPDEKNILINPARPNSAKLNAVVIRRWIYDPRFFR